MRTQCSQSFLCLRRVQGISENKHTCRKDLISRSRQKVKRVVEALVGGSTVDGLECGGRALRQRPGGGGQQPESQPRPAAGAGAAGWLGTAVPQTRVTVTVMAPVLRLRPGWLQKLVPLQRGVVCQVYRVPTRARPGAGDREAKAQSLLLTEVMTIK